MCTVPNNRHRHNGSEFGVKREEWPSDGVLHAVDTLDQHGSPVVKTC